MAVTEERKEAFVKAVQDGDVSGTRALLEEDPAIREQIDAPWMYFDAPAIVQASGNRELVDVLLEFGADVNAKSDWWAGGFTAMHFVTGRMVAFNAEMASYLIERGAEVDAWAAAGLGMSDRLEALVEADPEVVKQPGPDGMRPLHFSATSEIAQFLLDKGADIDARCIDHHGTAAQWGLGNNNMALSQYLVDNGAEGDVFLYAALGDLERLSATLDADADVANSRMDREAPGGYVYLYTSIGRQCTPLHAAATHDQVEAARLLIERGADPNLREPTYDGTPLGWAVHFNAGAAAEFLRSVTRQD